MLRVGISVEGATEREFVNQVMMPYFLGLNVFVTPVSMNGNVSLARIRHELPPLLGSIDHKIISRDDLLRSIWVQAPSGKKCRRIRARNTCSRAPQTAKKAYSIYSKI